MTDNQVLDRIGEEIAANDVVLFMKGTRQFPQCGFSAAVTNVLSQLGVPFKGVDVLAELLCACPQTARPFADDQTDSSPALGASMQSTARH